MTRFQLPPYDFTTADLLDIARPGRIRTARWSLIKEHADHLQALRSTP